MLDECMGSAIVGLFEAEFLPVTISMTTEFIRPVPPGEILGEGRVTAINGKSAFLEGRLMNAAGELLVRSVGGFRRYPFPARSEAGLRQA